MEEKWLYSVLAVSKTLYDGVLQRPLRVDDSVPELKKLN